MLTLNFNLQYTVKPSLKIVLVVHQNVSSLVQYIGGEVMSEVLVLNMP